MDTQQQQTGLASAKAAHTKSPTKSARQRRFARTPQGQTGAAETPLPDTAPRRGKARKRTAGAPTRLDQLEALLVRKGGPTLAEMTEATGWQQHSVRGAIAGALKQRGLVITSDNPDGTRIYRGTRIGR